MRKYFKPGSIVKLHESNNGSIGTDIIRIQEYGPEGFLGENLFTGLLTWYNIRSISFHAAGQISEQEIKRVMQQVEIMKEEGRLDI